MCLLQVLTFFGEAGESWVDRWGGPPFLSGTRAARRVINGTTTAEVLFLSNYYSVDHKVDKVEPNN